MGIGPEDTVAIMLRNDFPFFESSMAANFVGAHAVPINWHFQKVIEFSRELPREDSGKIFKRKLRAPYWEKAGRQI